MPVLCVYTHIYGTSRSWPQSPGDRCDSDLGSCRFGLFAAMRSGLQDTLALVSAPQAKAAVSLVAVQVYYMYTCACDIWWLWWTGVDCACCFFHNELEGGRGERAVFAVSFFWALQVWQVRFTFPHTFHSSSSLSLSPPFPPFVFVSHSAFFQACFECAMYVCLFEWTPVLNASMVELRGMGIPPPYGLVFASLMASLMLGSHAYQV